MKVRLEVSHSKANVKRVVLTRNAVIGRSPECNLRIASGQVSRKHCEILVGENGVFARDLGSSNGTFVGEQRLEPFEDVPVPPGTSLSIGGVRFVVRYELSDSETLGSGSTINVRAGDTKRDAEPAVAPAPKDAEHDTVPADVSAANPAEPAEPEEEPVFEIVDDEPAEADEAEVVEAVAAFEIEDDEDDDEVAEFDFPDVEEAPVFDPGDGDFAVVDPEEPTVNTNLVDLVEHEDVEAIVADPDPEPAPQPAKTKKAKTSKKPRAAKKPKVAKPEPADDEPIIVPDTEEAAPAFDFAADDEVAESGNLTDFLNNLD